MKRIISVCVVVLLAVSLVGCGFKPVETEMTQEAISAIAEKISQHQYTVITMPLAYKTVKARVEAQVKEAVSSKDDRIQYEMLPEQMIADTDIGKAFSVSYQASCSGKKYMALTLKMTCEVPFICQKDGICRIDWKNRNYIQFEANDYGNSSWILNHPYIPMISKAEVIGKTKEEIAVLLMEQWMESLTRWDSSKRTFRVTKYKKPEVTYFESTDEIKDWGEFEGKTGPLPKYPNCVESWLVSYQCEYQFIGYTSNVSLTEPYSGRIFGVEPFWVKDFAPSMENDFVLTEWADGYSLETRRHCQAALGEIKD